MYFLLVYSDNSKSVLCTREEKHELNVVLCRQIFKT